MIPMLLRLLADFVFESAAGRHRSFDADMSRYFEDRGFRTPPPATPAR